jgi:N6-adenosine-specific RNA methylase IME4
MSGKYRTIVADPPWPVKDFGARTLSTAGQWRERHVGPSKPVPYERMSIDEIAALPVNELAELDAHVYLWTFGRFVPDAYRMVADWGFSYSALLTWCKQPRGLGFGGAYVPTTEFVLFARRGRLAHKQRVDTSWWSFKRPYARGGHPTHSAKPEGMQDVIESVSPGPYLELFARRNRLGWDTWGNEALEHVTMAVST